METVPYIKPRQDREAIADALTKALERIHDCDEIISIAWAFGEVRAHLTLPSDVAPWDFIGSYGDEIECHGFTHLTAKTDGVVVTVVGDKSKPMADGMYTRVNGQWVKS